MMNERHFPRPGDLVVRNAASPAVMGKQIIRISLTNIQVNQVTKVAWISVTVSASTSASGAVATSMGLAPSTYQAGRFGLSKEYLPKYTMKVMIVAKHPQEQMQAMA